jgi:hypothetical protein
MTVIYEKPAINLRAELAALRALVAQNRTVEFWFAGNGSTTTFTLKKGWKPRHVFVNGALYRPGTGEDYTTRFDGFVWSVVMAVAPAAVDVGIIAEVQL